MVCMVLAESAAQREQWQYALENLGEDWRCLTAANARQARSLLAADAVEVLLLCPGRESADCLSWLTAQPPIAPPWVLGDGLSAPDGMAPPAVLLPGWLAQRRRDGLLPALAGAHHARAEQLAAALLRTLGMPARLRAWEFLPDMLALAVVHPPLLTDLTHGLYPLIARRHGLSPAAVERSLRLCVESIWSRGSIDALDRFFGASVDPERGKPTNREFLCRLQERLTFSLRRIL